VSDFLVYHNPDTMKYSAREITGLSIVTNKPATGVKGARVWLITGEGKPRTYYLCGHFFADEVGPSPQKGFRTRVAGSRGLLIRKWPVLNDEPWFPDFRRGQGNFAFGLQPIADRVVIRELERIAKQAK
jgi:hypothetical protein